MDLLALLSKRAGSRARASALIVSTAEEIGVLPDSTDRILVALALCRTGELSEEVAASLSWKEFESFCSDLFRAYGFAVKENVILTKPKVQLDVVASGPSITLSVDCKHWRRAHSPGALRTIAKSQLRRSEVLRRKSPSLPRIVSSILSLSEPEGSFVDGVAVVPLRTLRSFLSSVESFSHLLEFR